MARNLTRALYVVSIIPVLTGLWTVVAGGDSVPAPNDAPPNVESELRFYSVWWIGAGLFVAWLAPRVEKRTLELRVFFALLFLGGVSRALAALDTDRPSTGQIVLMALELVLPVVFISWQALVVRSIRAT